MAFASPLVRQSGRKSKYLSVCPAGSSSAAVFPSIYPTICPSLYLSGCLAGGWRAGWRLSSCLHACRPGQATPTRLPAEGPTQQTFPSVVKRRRPRRGREGKSQTHTLDKLFVFHSRMQDGPPLDCLSGSERSRGTGGSSRRSSPHRVPNFPRMGMVGIPGKTLLIRLRERRCFQSCSRDSHSKLCSALTDNFRFLNYSHLSSGTPSVLRRGILYVSPSPPPGMAAGIPREQGLSLAL